MYNNYDKPNIKILDASYFINGGTLKARELYTKEHIPNSFFFDIDDIANINSQLPHTIPNQNTFNRKISELGINNNNNIIIYDSSSGVSAASRAWWMFKQFGHDNVSILDGGFQKWKMDPRMKTVTPTQCAEWMTLL